MKFVSRIAEEIFRKEFEVSGLEDIEEFLFQRRKLEFGLVDKERSRLQKQNWRKYRWKYLKGIRRFHRSTAGKRFHRQLGRWLATRPMDKLVYLYDKEKKELERERKEGSIEDLMDYREFLIGATSAFTHALIEKRYIGLLEEDVQYDLFLEYFWEKYVETIGAMWDGEGGIDWDWWIGVVSPSEWEKIFEGLKIDEGFYEDFKEEGDYWKWFVDMRKWRKLVEESDAEEPDQGITS